MFPTLVTGAAVSKERLKYHFMKTNNGNEETNTHPSFEYIDQYYNLRLYL